MKTKDLSVQLITISYKKMELGSRRPWLTSRIFTFYPEEVFLQFAIMLKYRKYESCAKVGFKFYLQGVKKR